jgi:hypothetical protein
VEIKMLDPCSDEEKKYIEYLVKKYSFKFGIKGGVTTGFIDK